MPQGRPKSIRVAGSGDKLYMALKLSGLSWGTRIGANHVAANPRWAECGLPRSINTVIEDIRSGIPLNRLERYAGFFQVPAALFADTALSPYAPAFSCAILENRRLAAQTGATGLPLPDASMLEHARGHNAVERNFLLYQLLAGIYDLYYKKDDATDICLGCAVIKGQTGQGIGLEGLMVFDGVAVDTRGVLFRWQNMLHIQYHTEDFQILGYLLAADPMQSYLARNRRPLLLRFKGLGGSMAGAPTPQSFMLCAVKHENVPSEGWEEDYARLLETVHARPGLRPDADGYGAAAALFQPDEM